MNSVAAGNFIDEETGESLNDVETVLNELGIKLRDVNGEFRNSGEVLDEVAERWNTFDSVAQHAIATAFAGTRQQEKFITLMEHYSEAVEYAEVATDSAGTATEKYNSWLEGIEGKLNTLKTTFQELAMAVLDSDLITGVADFMTWLLEALTWLVDKIGGLNTVLYATVSLIAIINADSIITFITGIGTAITKLIGFISSLISSMKIAKAQGITTGQFISNAFQQITAGASTAQLAVAAFVAVISALLITVNLIKQEQEKAIQRSLSSAQAYLSEAEAANNDKASLDALIKKYEELAEKNNGVWDDKTAQTVKGIQDEIVSLVGEQALAIDLVNGKLETELGILKDITGESNKVTLAAAQSALTDAKAAIQAAMDKFEWGDNQYYEIGIAGTGGLKSYGNIQTETVPRSFLGAGGSMKVDTIKVKFDTSEEFAAQYEAVQEYKNKIAGTIDETNGGALVFYEELNEYLATYKDVYNTYIAARDLVTELTTPPETSAEDATNEVKGLTVALKSAYDILEEVQGGYDGLANALTDVTEEGYLTADALSTLFKLESDNALAGLNLKDILIRDANGYKLAGGALQEYVQALIAQYTITEAFATLQDKKNAITNLKTLQAVLATLAQTQDDSTEVDKRRREELEKQQDAYNEQLDAYRELIDIRKDLLQTYEEELSYQKELAKRQHNVTALQTKLSVARLDQSAAGQARVRELEAELKAAQDDLQDYTLEHAIDVLSNQLENQYSEYETFIKDKLDKIADLIDNLDTSAEVNVTTDTSWIKAYLEEIQILIDSIQVSKVPASDGVLKPATLDPTFAKQEQNSVWTTYQDAVDAGYSNIRTAHEFARGGSDKEKYGTYAKYLEAMYRYYKVKGRTGKFHTGGLVGDIATLSSSEAFAKLLKGEFVSTPVQMKRFMEETLPQIANYSASEASNEFNAPLIEITCESVTSEALPELERVVNEAVKEIKKQLDSGMSRTGYKRTPTKRLT